MWMDAGGVRAGAGLIKLRGGSEWRDFTAMDYFYEARGPHASLAAGCSRMTWPVAQLTPLQLHVDGGGGLVVLVGWCVWQTQPVPNPVSYYMHQSPKAFHKFEVGAASASQSEMVDHGGTPLPAT